ncbi:MAG TPA: hypothetical protein PLK34_00190 [Candidatus Pacearchaeota archaeon]|nr:hypothetical protein [Candidatus Pacearchaeota archaeon]
MDEKLIKEAMFNVGGKPAESLVGILDGKKYTNEFLIAKKLDLTINQTRNILYKLSEQGMVSSTRKKDKKKGWYTYSWKIEELRALEFLRGILDKRIEQLQNQIKNRETVGYYSCTKCNIEFNEENALIQDFTCPECESILERSDNTNVIKAFKRNFEELEKKLGIINKDIEEEKTRHQKQKDRAVKKAVKFKKEERMRKSRETREKKKKLLKKEERKKAREEKKKEPKSKSKPKKASKKDSSKKKTKKTSKKK